MNETLEALLASFPDGKIVRVGISGRLVHRDPTNTEGPHCRFSSGGTVWPYTVYEVRKFAGPLEPCPRCWPEATP